MNKLFMKVATLSVGLAMAIGVGVAVGSNNNSLPVEAAVSSVSVKPVKALTGLDSSTSYTTTSTAFTSTVGGAQIYICNFIPKGTNDPQIRVNQGNTTSLSSNNFWMYNSTAFSDHITKITITFDGTVTKNYFQIHTSSSSALSSNQTFNSDKAGTQVGSTSQYKWEFNYSDSIDYFRFSCAKNGGTVKISEFTLYYGQDASQPSLSDISASPAKHTLSVGNTTGITLSTTPSSAGSNIVSWSSIPSNAGISFSTTSGNSTTVKFPSGANALAAGTEVTITATLTNTVSKSYKIWAIANDGTISNPYNAIEAKYLTIDGDTASHYVSGYISSTPAQKYFWIDTTASSTQTFEVYNANNISGNYLAKGRHILAHGTFAYFNSTTPEMTGSVIDRVDYVTLSTSSMNVNNTQTATLSISATGGDVEWSTTPGTGSVSLSGGSNSGVTITGTSVGTATVTATVGTASASCTVTVLEYATDWEFKDLVLVTGTGFVSEYEVGEEFDDTGITVNLYEYSESLKKDRGPIDVTSDCTFNFDSSSAGTFILKATYAYTNPDSSITNHDTDDEVEITIIVAPGRVYFGNYTASNGYMKPTSSAKTGKDSKGNDVVIETAATSFTNSGGTLPNTQIGSSTDAGNVVVIKITLPSKAGIDSLSVTFASSTSVTASMLAYTDGDESNVILSDTATSSTLKTTSTDSSYNKVNGTVIYVKLTPSSNAGVKIASIIYTTGETVKDFEHFSTLEILTGASFTEFKINETFTAEGLVLRATDSINDVTKDIASGFTTDFDDHEFDEDEVEEGTLTVTVSLTLVNTTKTVTYTITVIDPPTYTAISSQSDLYEGMKVLIYGAANYAMSGYNTGGYMNEAEVELTDGVITDAGEAYEFTVRIYGNSGFALQHGTQYLQYTGSSNAAYLSTTLDTKAVWTYSTSAGLVNVANTGRELRDNHGNTRFACYTNTTGTRVSIYVSSASSKTDKMGAETFAQKYLHMRDYDPELHVGVEGSGYCKDSHNYYLTAKAAYNDLSSEEQAEFANLSDAKARYEAWGRAKNDSDPYDGYDDVHTPISGKIFLNGDSTGASTTFIIIAVSLVGVAAIGGYFLFKKKKQN